MRIAHISDSQIIDEESPARLVFADDLVAPAWRPHEASSTQLLDGTIRVINRYHTSGTHVDALVHTGDAVDNVQSNELAWFLTIMDGGTVDPRSGPDDRDTDDLPAIELDPHAPFQAEGLYQTGVHGPFESIPWYIVSGNHDRFALGVFPVIELPWKQRIAPLPLAPRFGLFLPAFLDPAGWTAYDPITPAHPGPPSGAIGPAFIEPRAERRYFSAAERNDALSSTQTQPPGHGTGSNGCFSAELAPGIRLIGIGSSTPSPVQSGGVYSEGSINLDQILFLLGELDAACAQGDRVIIASHHPSESLQLSIGSAVGPNTWRALLHAYPCVDVHLAGHSHVNRVRDQGNYLEIETGSTLDYPQEGRFVEIWKSDDEIDVAYWMFSHIQTCDDIPGCVESRSADPLYALRHVAFDLAQADSQGSRLLKGRVANRETTDVLNDAGPPYGTPTDRSGTYVKSTNSQR